MRENRFLDAALAAADRGWAVFPLRPGSKKPALHGDTPERPCLRTGICRDGHLGWEQRATTDSRQIYRWWAGTAWRNVGVAAGKSGLVVLDLDNGGGLPPQRFAGARDGWDVLAILAAEVGAELPTDTYAVETPRGCHLYFRAPAGLTLRNTTGKLGWNIDTRAHGGYVVAAGSQRSEGDYCVICRGPLDELPGWLAKALAPAPTPAPRPPMRLSRHRATTYVRAIVASEANEVATARTGTRHDTLLRAARTLGRLVGGDELAEDHARHVLLDAAARHVGVDDCTVEEVTRAIDDGIAYGKRLPRRITHDPDDGPATTDQSSCA